MILLSLTNNRKKFAIYWQLKLDTVHILINILLTMILVDRTPIQKLSTFQFSSSETVQVRKLGKTKEKINENMEQLVAQSRAWLNFEKLVASTKATSNLQPLATKLLELLQ